jgi:superfamily I DNA/RNA helicase
VVPVAELLVALDDRQREAATLGPGPAQIIAPAGSGKTSTLVARIGVLIGAGTPPPRILVVTFNRDAATELSQRIVARLGPTPGRDGPEVRTLHALARQVRLEDPRPLRLVADRLPLLRAARRQVLATLPPGSHLPPAEELDGVVAAAVLEGRRPGPPLDAVVDAYQDRLTAGGATDFDGLLAGALRHLQVDPSLRARWQAKYDHVLVDEFQDVDATQVDLVALLAEPQRNLFVVGDDDQTIYAWRLADVRRILDFPVRYPDATRIVLETNYRCPPAVVAAADRLIAGNRERVPKRLRAANEPDPGAPSPIQLWRLRGADAAERLASHLPGWAAEHRRLAVLARTRSELAPIVAALTRSGIRHATNLPAAVEAQEVSTLVENALSADPARPAFHGLLAARSRLGWMLGDRSEGLGEEAQSALDAAIGWAVGFGSTADYARELAAARRRLEALRDPEAPIELTTVHGSKGREWPRVVVRGLEVERFPNQRSLDDAVDPARTLEEERRLAYVAVTRARERLVLAFDPERPSPFVGDLVGGNRRDTLRRPSSQRGRLGRRFRNPAPAAADLPSPHHPLDQTRK